MFSSIKQQKLIIVGLILALVSGRAFSQTSSPFEEEEAVGGVHWPVLNHLWSALSTGHLDPLSVHPLLTFTQLDSVPKDLDDSVLDSPALILSHLESKLASRTGIGWAWEVLKPSLLSGPAKQEAEEPGQAPVCPQELSFTNLHNLQWNKDGEIVPPQTSWTSVPSFVKDIELTLADVGLQGDQRESATLVFSSNSQNPKLNLTNANVFAFGPGTSLLASSIAKAQQDATVVVLHDPEAPSSPVKITESNFISAFRDTTGVNNLFLCSRELSPELIDDALNSHVRSDLTILLDFHWLAGRHLPMETEYILGRVMSFSDTMVLPSELPDARYFSFWSSMASMVERSAASAGLTVKTYSISGSRSSTSQRSSGLLLVAIQSKQQHEANALTEAKQIVVGKAVKAAQKAVEQLRLSQERKAFPSDTSTAGGSSSSKAATLTVSEASNLCKAQVQVFQAVLRESLSRQLRRLGISFDPSKVVITERGPQRATATDARRSSRTGISASVLVALGLGDDDRSMIMGRLMAGDYQQGPAVIPHRNAIGPTAQENLNAITARVNTEGIPSLFSVRVIGNHLIVIRGKDIIFYERKEEVEEGPKGGSTSDTAKGDIGKGSSPKSGMENFSGTELNAGRGQTKEGIKGTASEKQGGSVSTGAGAIGGSPGSAAKGGNTGPEPNADVWSNVWSENGKAGGAGTKDQGGTGPSSMAGQANGGDTAAPGETEPGATGSNKGGNAANHQPSDLAKAWNGLFPKDEDARSAKKPPFDPFAPRLPSEKAGDEAAEVTMEEEAEYPEDAENAENAEEGEEEGEEEGSEEEAEQTYATYNEDTAPVRSKPGGLRGPTARRLSGALATSLSPLSRQHRSSATSPRSPGFYGYYGGGGNPFGPQEEPNQVDFQSALLRLHGSQTVFSGFQPTSFESIHGSFAAAIAEEYTAEEEKKGHLPSVWNGNRIDNAAVPEVEGGMSDAEVVRLWKALKEEIINAAPMGSKDKTMPGMFPDAEAPSLLFYGQAMSQLGLKAALDLPKALVFNLFPTRAGVGHHMANLKLLSVPNNLVGVRKLNGDTLEQLSSLRTDVFRFMVADVDFWTAVAAAAASVTEPMSFHMQDTSTSIGWGLPPNIEAMDAASLNIQLTISSLLGLSHSTIIALPPWHSFLAAVATAYPDQLHDESIDEDLLTLTQEDPFAPFREPAKLAAEAKEAQKRHRARAGWTRIVPAHRKLSAAEETNIETPEEGSMQDESLAAMQRGLALDPQGQKAQSEEDLNTAFELAVSQAFDQLKVSVRSSSVASVLASLFDPKAEAAYTSLRAALRCRRVLKNEIGHCGYSRNQRETEPYASMIQELCDLPEGPCASVAVTKLSRPLRRPPRHKLTRGWDVYLRVDATKEANQQASMLGLDIVAPLPTSLSLHALLSLGLVPELRSDMLRLMLSLPYSRIFADAADEGYRISSAILQPYTSHATHSQPQQPPAEQPPAGSMPLSMAPYTIRYTVGGVIPAGRLTAALPASPALVYLVPEGPLAGTVYVSRGLVDFPPPPPALFSQTPGTAAFKEAKDVQEAWKSYAKEELQRWKALWRELEGVDAATGWKPGTFSLLELFSGPGVLGSEIARRFPQATVVSVEGSKTLSAAHLAVVLEENLRNNAVCKRSVDTSLVKSMQKSPEFLRFQIMGASVIDIMEKLGLSDTQEFIGTALSLAATTFLRLPSSMAFSHAFTTLFHSYRDSDIVVAPSLSQFGEGQLGENRFFAENHPRPAFANFAHRFLSDVVKTKTSTKIAINRVGLPLSPSSSWAVEGNLLRLDLLNVTRRVQHHFESERDGHERTYTLRVEVNTTATALLKQYGPTVYQARGVRPATLPQDIPVVPVGNHPSAGRIISVRLQRHMDKAHIPYDSLYGITLIAAMRLGLQAPQRVQMYHEFVAMPLYQDQTPWNIVLKGPTLDYIDFDTKDHTYDDLIPKAFEMMEVFFNYKRTIEDFQRCGDKAPVLYGFSLISNCVGSDFRGPCDDHSKPVPCGDGTCHSDYISCLRAISKKQLIGNDKKRLRGEESQARNEALRHAANARLALLDYSHAHFPRGNGATPPSPFLGKDVLTFSQSGVTDDDTIA